MMDVDYVVRLPAVCSVNEAGEICIGPARFIQRLIHCRDCCFYKTEHKGKPWKASRSYCTRSASMATDPEDFCSKGRLVQRKEV